MSVSLSPLFNGWQGFTIAGIPMSGGLVNTYLAGTTTPAGTYTTSAGTILNANPIQLDAAGLPPSEIWLTDGVTYKFVVTDSLGLNPRTYDNIAGGTAGTLATSTGSNLVGFIQSGTGAVAETVQTKLREQFSVKDFGARGDNTTDDTVAINAAITAAGVSTYPSTVFFPPGYYKVTGPINIPQASITLQGSNPRNTQIMLSGTGVVNVIGTSARVDSFNMFDISINGFALASGYAMVIDFTQNVFLENVYIIDPWNGVSLRQSGNIRFNHVVMSSIRGTLGVFAFGNNTTRNSQNDQIDVLIFDDVILQSSYVSGGAVNTTDCLSIDGRVQTIEVNGLRCLNAGRGVVTTNTPALATNLVPRFILGADLEIENMYSNCMYLDYMTDFWVYGIFVAGSNTANGIVLNNVNNFVLHGGTVNSNSLSGILNTACTYMSCNDVTVYANSGAGVASKCAYDITTTTGTVKIAGGVAGKAFWLPAYTENQKAGVGVSAGFGGTLLMDKVYVKGNQTAGVIPGGSEAVGTAVRDCPGYNPIGAATQVAGASPYTYTAGVSPETLNIFGGTVSSITVGAISCATATNCTVVLNPRQAAVITYTVAPTICVNKQ